MASEPKRIIRAVADNYDFIRELMDRHRGGGFSVDDALNALSKSIAGDSTHADRVAQLEKLQSLDVIIGFARSDHLQLNDDTRTYLEALLCEYELGLIEELQGYIRDIGRRIDSLNSAYQSRNADEFEQSARLLDTRLRHCMRYMERNEQAIAELVTEAKSRTTEVGAQYRYRRVLEAWELYLDPLIQMVKPEGEFFIVIDRAKSTMVHLASDANATGRLISHMEVLEHVVARANELIKFSRDTLKRSVERVRPLKDAIRQNTAVTEAVASCLRQVEKRQLKLDKALAGMLAGSKHSRTISSHAALEAAYESFTEFEADAPSICFDAVDADDTTTGLDLEQVLAHLSDDAPVDDLFGWLSEHYPGYTDTQVIRAYYALAEHAGTHIVRREQPSDYSLEDVVFQTHSFSIKQVTTP